MALTSALFGTVRSQVQILSLQFCRPRAEKIEQLSGESSKETGKDVIRSNTVHFLLLRRALKRGLLPTF
jgi:hypothetical protein